MISPRLLSHERVGRIGEVAGSLSYRLSSNRRRIACRTLSRALPNSTQGEVSALARASFRHAGAAMLESISFARLEAQELCRLIDFENWHFFRQAEDSMRGVIVLTAHLGVHELVGPAVALFRGPMHMIARPLANAAAERRVRGIRERFGNRTIHKRNAARGMLRALRKKERVAILIDQRVHPNQGVRVPFFDIPSWTSPLPAQASLRSGAPVLPLFAYRLDDSRYRVVASPPIDPPRVTDQPSQEEIDSLTAKFSAVTETAIRRALPQWLWMHDRWRRH